MRAARSVGRKAARTVAPASVDPAPTNTMGLLAETPNSHVAMSRDPMAESTKPAALIEKAAKARIVDVNLKMK